MFLQPTSYNLLPYIIMYRTFRLIFGGLLLILFQASAFADTIQIKMEVTNPSEADRVLPVKTYLPKGIKPEDVLDKGGFAINYDFEKALYFAYKDVTLKPKETMMLQLGINDIWTIAQDQIDSLTAHTQQLWKALQKSDDAKKAKTLVDFTFDHLQKITEAQNQPNLSVQQRMSNYEISTGLLRQAKEKIGTLEEMALNTTNSQGKVGALMGENTITIDPLEDLPNLGTLQFSIEASNPSQETKNIPLTYYLPIEVKPEFIVDKGAFEVAYDFQKGVYYLSNKEMSFNPGETKKFAVKIKDLWVIPDAKIQKVKEKTQKLMRLLQGSVYKQSAELLQKQIIGDLDDISVKQKDKTASVDNHIGQYRVNLAKFQEALKNLAKMEQLSIPANSSNEMFYQQILSPQQKGSKMEGLRGARGVEIIGKTIFQGKAPDLATTWKVIWTIIAFLAILSFLFFILWWGQVRIGQGKEYKDVQNDNPQP